MMASYFLQTEKFNSFSQTSPPEYGLGNFVIQSWGIILFGKTIYMLKQAR